MSEPAPGQRRGRGVALDQRITQLRAELDRLEAKRKERSRKLDARQKIVIGGTVIAEMRSNVNFAAMIKTLLRDRVTRPFDKEAIAEWLLPDSIDSKPK